MSRLVSVLLSSASLSLSLLLSFTKHTWRFTLFWNLHQDENKIIHTLYIWKRLIDVFRYQINWLLLLLLFLHMESYVVDGRRSVVHGIDISLDYVMIPDKIWTVFCFPRTWWEFFFFNFHNFSQRLWHWDFLNISCFIHTTMSYMQMVLLNNFLPKQHLRWI